MCIRDRCFIAHSFLCSLQNSALSFEHIAPDQQGSNFDKNFLLVNTEDKNSSKHESSYFSMTDKENWKNIPPVLKNEAIVIGIRRVYWKAKIHILVEIKECYPVPGRTHYSFYNNGKWSEWK